MRTTIFRPLLIAPIVLVLLVFGTPGRGADEYPELRREIQEWERKIADTEKKIASVKGRAAQDKEEFQAYRARHRQYRSEQKALLDSLRRDHTGLREVADSLTASLQTLRMRQDEYDRRQEAFRRRLVGACREVARFVDSLPPGNVDAQRKALEFLRSELASKSASTIEGLERLWQIVLRLADDAEALEVYSGASPLEGAADHGYFVRIGFAYLAFVNEEGSSAALWIPAGDSLSARWVELERQSKIASLHQAVRIRQGKTVPEIIGLPMHHPVVTDSVYTEGRQR